MKQDLKNLVTAFTIATGSLFLAAPLLAQSRLTSKNQFFPQTDKDAAQRFEASLLPHEKSLYDHLPPIYKPGLYQDHKGSRYIYVHDPELIKSHKKKAVFSVQITNYFPETGSFSTSDFELTMKKISEGFELIEEKAVSYSDIQGRDITLAQILYPAPGTELTSDKPATSQSATAEKREP